MLIKCYAEGRSDKWEAVCLNFDIAVNGDSLEDVIKNMDEAVGLYLGRLSELPPEERDRLLHRQSPLSLRLKFLSHVLRATLGREGGPNDKGRAEFVLPCAA
jgi:hypothetical protein